jgi:branched-chain amino acid transport system permease protein
MDKMSNSLVGTRAWTWYIITFIVVMIVPFVASAFWTNILTEILIMGLAAISVNLLLGFGGSLPFGHAAFFASGAYATALLIKETSLPFIGVLVVAPAVAAVIGAIFGLIITRLYEFYYAIVSAASGMVLWTLIRKVPILGGDTGITGMQVPALLDSVNSTYIFTAIIVFIVLIFTKFLLNSPFGWIQQAIRENPTRVTCTGSNVLRHRYIAFVISSYICGIAGMLFVIHTQSTFPSYAHWVKSGDFVMICILGGVNTFIGPMIGAAALIILQTYITSVTEHWLLFLGIIICLVVIFMPNGLMGLVGDLREKVNLFTKKMNSEQRAEHRKG